ncbi:MAG: hypothetical protein KDA42_05660 [Planctomycetales bacterium]|nr:hypothetical protein [Planctomycetales bacterium]
MKLLKALWRDQCGGLLSAEYVLLGTLLTLGVIVGLTAVRNAIVQELADLAAAICAIDTGTTAATVSFPSSSAEEGTDVFTTEMIVTADEAFGETP